MPLIITAPTRTRNDSRGVDEATIAEYIEAMNDAESIGPDQIVIVDDSDTDNYEKSYARGERIRQAIIKAKATDRKIEVRGVRMKDEDEEYFVASMKWKA